ncbi:hypothetical protein KUV78_03815 [Marinobacter hydrocarbonoclasticus]|uniref:DUF6316 family protein n=1 Tax=Marinobacter nauticus TaxID=2743 RepID=UPI001C95B6FF|nr:DUF6316 family protein [Marinobacter nauticus]MBY6192917.1 hypothetical protein [Marinobacter nauticus]MBY6214065.1 hypothetical protein [Marinobacter nauticus]
MAKLFSRRKRGVADEPGDNKVQGVTNQQQNPDDVEDQFPERSRFVRVAPSRIVKTHIGWFALTREQDDLGPFPSEELAEDALHEYLKRVEPNRSRAYSPFSSCGVLIHDSETCSKRHCAFCIEARVLAEDNWNELIDDIDFTGGDSEW